MDQRKLISALERRDPEAIEQVVHTYGDRLLRAACLLCGNEADAQDLVQDTLVEALGSVHRFRGQSSLYTWLRAILLNLSRHYHRSRSRLIYDDELSNREVVPNEDNCAPLDLETASAALSQALARLSSAHREVLILRYFEQMKIQEIAAHLRLSKGTIKSRLHYAIADLQKLMPKEMNLFGTGGTKQVNELNGLNELDRLTEVQSPPM